MAMQIILTQDVANLGKAGELVTVRPATGATTWCRAAWP
jgi:hypothetical protein